MERSSSTKTQAIMAKKACKTALLHLKNAISSTNILLLKLAAKAHHSVFLNHAFTEFIICGATDAVPAFNEYEFSCSNTPAFTKLRRRRRRYKPVDEAAVAAAVQRVFDMLNAEAAAATPMVLPGFGKSPAVCRLRVTDSPFPVKENEEESRIVSKAAEEFIRKFYRGLKREKSFESPFRSAINTPNRSSSL